MTRHDDALEKAAEASVSHDWDSAKWDSAAEPFRDEYRRLARAAVAAYEAHMRPQITTVDGLPVGTLIQMRGIPSPFLLTDDGWESTRFAGKPVHDYIADPERYPARVLHWGDA